jgi:hypothetical protein
MTQSMPIKVGPPVTGSDFLPRERTTERLRRALEVGHVLFIAQLIFGIALNPENGYGLWLLTRHWRLALLPAAAKIAANESGADNLRAVLTEVLLEQAAAGERAAVRDALLNLDDTGQAIFEPLLLALKALDDRAILSRIAREKRDLVLDVMQRIEGGDGGP